MKVYEQSIHEYARVGHQAGCGFLVSSEPSIILQFEPSDHQPNRNDYCLFALAFCTDFSTGKDPQGLQFDQKTMRQHLFRCLTQGHTKPFPCNCTIQAAVAKTYQIAIYCTSRTQEAGSMVECKRCEEWYHENALGCQSMFGRKEAFHESADTAVNTSQHVCMIYFTNYHNLFIHMHCFKTHYIAHAWVQIE